MKKAILATKVGMTQIFNEDGSINPGNRTSGWTLRSNSGEDRRQRRLQSSTGRFC